MIITTIWQGSDNEGSLSLTVSFLLAPFNNKKLTFQEVQEISLAVFRLNVLHVVYKFTLNLFSTDDTGAPEVTSQSTVWL